MFAVLLDEIQSFFCVEIVCIEYILAAAIAHDLTYFILYNEFLQQNCFVILPHIVRIVEMSLVLVELSVM